MKRKLDVTRYNKNITFDSLEHTTVKTIPVNKIHSIKHDYGFGMWRDDVDKRSVAEYVRELRKSRFQGY